MCYIYATTKVAPCGLLATFLHTNSLTFLWLQVEWAIGGVRLVPPTQGLGFPERTQQESECPSLLSIAVIKH